MSNKTVEAYYDLLEDEFTWRKVELRNYKMVVDKQGLLTDRKQPLIRAGVALLYAHWEGFIVSASEIYLQFINQKKCCVSSVKHNFICLFIQQKARTFPNTYKASLYEDIAKKLIPNRNEKLDFSTKVETKSNLKYDLFREILWKLGLDENLFSLKKELINRKLVDNRNTIAHGKYCVVDYKDYLELHDGILEMLEIFKNIIQNAIETNSHLRELAS